MRAWRRTDSAICSVGAPTWPCPRTRGAVEWRVVSPNAGRGGRSDETRIAEREPGAGPAMTGIRRNPGEQEVHHPSNERAFPGLLPFQA